MGGAEIRRGVLPDFRQIAQMRPQRIADGKGVSQYEGDKNRNPGQHRLLGARAG